MLKIYFKIYNKMGRSRKDPYSPPTEEISAIRRGRGEKIVSDNNKCIRTSEGGRGVNFLFPLWGWYPWMFSGMTQYTSVCYYSDKW
jgi:hypothetical protein